MNNNYDVYMCRKPQSAFELAAEMRQKEGFEDYDYGAIAKCPDGDEWFKHMRDRKPVQVRAGLYSPNSGLFRY